MPRWVPVPVFGGAVRFGLGVVPVFCFLSAQLIASPGFRAPACMPRASPSSSGSLPRPSGGAPSPVHACLGQRPWLLPVSRAFAACFARIRFAVSRRGAPPPASLDPPPQGPLPPHPVLCAGVLLASAPASFIRFHAGARFLRPIGLLSSRSTFLLLALFICPSLLARLDDVAAGVPPRMYFLLLESTCICCCPCSCFLLQIM